MVLANNFCANVYVIWYWIDALCSPMDLSPKRSRIDTICGSHIPFHSSYCSGDSLEEKSYQHTSCFLLYYLSLLSTIKRHYLIFPPDSFINSII
jgi:hypothetical protein